MATKTVKTVAQAKVWEIRDAVWSPDSRWIAYSQEEAEGMNRVYSILVEQGKTTPSPTAGTAPRSPAFSGDGKYLFFVSNAISIRSTARPNGTTPTATWRAFIS